MREMRRKDRLTSVERAWEILENAEFMTLSMTGADGAPYGVALSFARVGQRLYFHSADAGYKLDSLRKDGRVCVTAVLCQRSVPEDFTTVYASAVAFGRAVEVTDRDEKEQGLLAICKKYAPENPNAAAYLVQYPSVTVWRVDVQELTGKENRK